MTARNQADNRKWRGRFMWLLSAWICTTVAMSFREVRGIVIYPLVVHNPDAKGEIAYVMADGPAYWERLHAASDLYHWDRVKEIYILDEQHSDGYHFVRKTSNLRVDRAKEYLEQWGVPRHVIQTVPQQPNDWLSSRSEAVGLAGMNKDFREIVVVTSPPHTRRCSLCFNRVFGGKSSIQLYSASQPHQSAETYSPIGLEYLKLTIYWFLA